MSEVWVDIEGYEGLYQVSNQGRVRSLPKPYFKGKKYLRDGYEMKQRLKPNGYMQIGLYKNGVLKTVCVHRLVAKAFIPNENNLPYVNHKDENKSNNIADNLEWCDAAYNIHYGNAIEKLSKAKRNNPIQSKPVAMYTLDGKLVNVFPSANEAQRRTGVDQAQVSKCCNKDAGYYTAGGYKWMYYEGD